MTVSWLFGHCIHCLIKTTDLLISKCGKRASPVHWPKIHSFQISSETLKKAHPATCYPPPPAAPPTPRLVSLLPTPRNFQWLDWGPGGLDTTGTEDSSLLLTNCFSFFYLLLRDLSAVCEEERNSLKFLSVWLWFWRSLCLLLWFGV